MKKISTIILLLALLASTGKKEKPTDLKEYGFKGKVKTVTSVNYADLEKKDGNWIMDEEKTLSKREMRFNEEGNITEMKETYQINKGVWNEVSTDIKFKKGLKRSYSRVNELGDVTEKGEYKWMDNKNYKITAWLSNGARMESFSVLNREFRDISGGSKYFQGTTAVSSETYVNRLSEQGEIISSEFTNRLTGDKYTIYYKDKEFDKNGNLVKIALINLTTSKLARLSIRQFEYYK